MKIAFLYDASVFIAEQLQSYFGVALYEDEIGYIALHLMGSAERLHSAAEKRIVIVSSIGNSGKIYYSERLKSIHEFNVSVVAVVSTFDLSVIADYSPDLIIAFKPLPKCSFPVYISRNMLSDEEREEIYSILRMGYKINTCYPLFDQNLFFTNVRADSKKEIIHFLCEKVKQKKYIGDEFENLVLTRDEVAPLAYGNLFAIPHPVRKEAYRDIVAVAILNNQIVWNNQKVKIVFLICSAKNSRNNFEDLYEKFAGMLNNQRKVKELIKSKSFDEFMRVFIDEE